jgi:ATP-binding cassette subfamily B protein
VSPQADPGETIGLAGPTGSRKATLMKLLLRFYDVSEGGCPGRRPRRPRRHAGESPLDGRLRQPGAVPVHWTVRENIAYGLEVTDDEVRSAAERANAHEFIADLEDGYETAVGQEGDWLSRGQRQRIAIACVILRDPEIIILDKATSHIDNETEVVIQRSLKELIADRTTFSIAHQLSTVRNAYRILVFEDGEIVERGSHDLLAADGLYANLWRIQVGEVDALPELFLAEVRRWS